jgi:hypothetical protein
MTGKATPIGVRFWQKVDCTAGLFACWIWLGSVGGNTIKYGRISYNGRVIGAHWVAWILHGGTIPEGMEIMHTCDNPLCVNPAHLKVGTHHENMLDRKYKNRGNHPTGERHPKAKLTIEQVEEIRALCRKGYTDKELGEIYDVTHASIYAIRNGINWKDRAMSAPRKERMD